MGVTCAGYQSVIRRINHVQPFKSTKRVRQANSSVVCEDSVVKNYKPS